MKKNMFLLIDFFKNPVLSPGFVSNNSILVRIHTDQDPQPCSHLSCKLDALPGVRIPYPTWFGSIVMLIIVLY